MSSAHPGDQAGARFDALAADLVEPLRRYLARRADPERAEALLEEALTECWRRRAEQPEDGGALLWAYGVARGRLEAVAMAEPGPPQGGPAQRRPDSAGPRRYRDYLDDSLREAVGRLRPAGAEVLRLWAWEQLTATEIATVLDITPSAAASRLRRAKAALRAEVDKDLQGPSDPPLEAVVRGEP